MPNIEHLGILMVPSNDLNRSLTRGTRECEVKASLEKMTSKKATRPNSIPIEYENA